MSIRRILTIITFLIVGMLQAVASLETFTDIRFTNRDRVLLHVPQYTQYMNQFATIDKEEYEKMNPAAKLIRHPDSLAAILAYLYATNRNQVAWKLADGSTVEVYVGVKTIIAHHYSAHRAYTTIATMWITAAKGNLVKHRNFSKNLTQLNGAIMYLNKKLDKRG